MSTQNGSANFSKRALTDIGYFIVVASAMLFVPATQPHPLQSSDGTLDATFGTAGQVRTNFSGSSFLEGLAIQPDGKIIVVGETGDASGSSVTLLRFNPDGSFDPSFGRKGKVFSKAGRMEGGFAVALLPDGKILMGGSAEGFGNAGDFAVARFNNDGSLDTSFGNGGVVVNDYGSVELGFTIKVQPDGKILLAGSAERGIRKGSAFALLRYKSEGTLDNIFGNNGKASVEFSSGFDVAYGMAIQPDGKIVLAGGTDASSFTSPLGLARFNSDGSLDSSFGNGGKVTTSFTDGQSEADAVIIQPDGKIIAAGFTEQTQEENLPQVLAIARYQSDGSLDTTFGSGGKVTYDFAGRGGEARALVLQRDGKILVAGAAGNYNADIPRVNFAVVRYNQDGSLDSSFGEGGSVIMDLGEKIDQATAIALQPDGKIVLGGFSGNLGIHTDMALVRYNNDSLAPDRCIQDDSNGNLLQFNPGTGDYKFTACAIGLTLSGKAVIKIKGCKTKLQAAAADHSLTVTINTCKGKANAQIDALAAVQIYYITDSHTVDNDCVCH